MEGIENNPMMFELMTELPWRSEKVSKEEWVKEYLTARYGTQDNAIEQAWTILANGILNCPQGNNQQGAHESIFCGRPSLNNFQVSSWSKMENYYDPTSTEEAARLMVQVADKYRGNNNFEYDLVDVVRQSLADRGRIVYNRTVADFKSFDKKAFKKHSEEFLHLLLLQDKLLGTRSEFLPGESTGPLVLPATPQLSPDRGPLVLGVLICYESIFPELARKQVSQGATLLVNISNDAWFGSSLGPLQHFQMARMRAIETGRDLLRATNTGITAAINHEGKVLKRAPQFEVATLSAEVTPRTGAPPYVRWRDWPVLGLTALGLGLLLLRRIRRHHRLGT